jgi:hypothetical protein
MAVFIIKIAYILCINYIRRPNMATKGTKSNSGRNYAGQNLHRGPALPPNNHDGGNWPSTHSGKNSGLGRGNAAPKGCKKGK